MVVIPTFNCLENLCPVCGFEMDDPPRDYNICPSCGTEFGVHDINASIEELRQAWLASGPKWWSKSDPQPPEWNPFNQLARLGLSSGPVVATVGVIQVTSTTSTVGPPVNAGGAGYVEVPWGQFEDRQSSLPLQ
jgi:hypothetical protein